MPEIYNHVEVDEQLSTSGVIPAEKFAALADDGFEIVINLLPADSQYAIADEADLVQRAGMEYVYIPVDFAAPAEADFHRFCSAMDAGGSKRVFVHCAANYRVSAFVSLYRQKRGTWNREQADAHIARLWEPDAAWTDLLRQIRAE